MFVPTLKPLDITVYKDKSGTDKAQVPALATIDLYRRGCIASETKTIPAFTLDVSLEVSSSAGIIIGDNLQVGVSGGTLGVSDVLGSSTIAVGNSSASDITVNSGDRLLFLSRRPTAYSTPLRTGALGSSFLTSASTGRALAYLEESRVDYTVIGSGIVPRLVPDASLTPELAWINASAFANLQDAVDSVPVDGGTVYIPTGTYSPTTVPAFTPPLVLPTDRPVRMLGNGIRQTTLRYRFSDAPSNYNPNLDLIHLTGDYQTIEGLTIEGGAGLPNPGTGVGIRIRRTGPSLQYGETRIVFRVCIRNCEIWETNSWGILIDNTPRNGEQQISVWALYENLEIHDNNQGGCVSLGEADSTTQYFRGCYFRYFTGSGVYAKNVAGISLTDCIIEKGGPNFIELDSCSSARVTHCWLEGSQHPDPWIQLLGASRGSAIDNCLFAKNSSTEGNDDLYGIYLDGGAHSASITNPYFILPGNAAAGSLAQIMVSSGAEATIVGGRLTDGVSGDRWPRITDDAARTVLLGYGARIRLPRVTTAERDGGSLPAWKAGDCIFNSTLVKAQVYDGTAWQNLW